MLTKLFLRILASRYAKTYSLTDTEREAVFVMLSHLSRVKKLMGISPIAMLLNPEVTQALASWYETYTNLCVLTVLGVSLDNSYETWAKARDMLLDKIKNTLGKDDNFPQVYEDLTRTCTEINHLLGI